MDFNTVLQGKYPARQHAKRVVDYIHSKVPGAGGALYLEGRAEKLLEDNDSPEPFRYASPPSPPEACVAYALARPSIMLTS
jgi:hypothetical protein